jgi:hypothetical protein
LAYLGIWCKKFWYPICDGLPNWFANFKSFTFRNCVILWQFCVEILGEILCGWKACRNALTWQLRQVILQCHRQLRSCMASARGGSAQITGLKLTSHVI